MRVLITGGLGQDGALLAHKHLSLGHEVNLLDHSIEKSRLWRLDLLGLLGSARLSIHEISNRQLEQFADLVNKVQPSRVYLLGDSSMTLDSFTMAQYNPEKLSTEILSQANFVVNSSPDCWLFLASSSEIFPPDGERKDEFSRLSPASPYGKTKEAVTLGADDLVTQGAKISTGILFPHESFLRNTRFVVGKILSAVGKYQSSSVQTQLTLGSPSAKRDWSSAEQFVDCIFSLGEKGVSGRAVLGSGRLLSVNQVLDLVWQVSGQPPLEDVSDSSGRLIGRASGSFVVSFSDRRFDKTDNQGCFADSTKVTNATGMNPGDTSRFMESIRRALAFHSGKLNIS